jgi:hypothetical protein
MSMEEPPALDQQPPPLPIGRRSAHAGARRGAAGRVLAALVIMSLLLGAAINWGWTQQRRNVHARAMLNIVQTDLTLLQARQADVVLLLADAETELLPFAPAHVTAEGRPALAVAWNPRMQRGVLLAGRLPLLASGEVYMLRAWSPGVAEAAAALSFEASHGEIARLFHLDRVKTVEEFRISQEPAGGNPAAPALYSASLH